MASHTISGQRWADGTTVSVYLASSWPDPANAPNGPAVTSAAVTSGAVTFNGVSERVRYVAYANGLGIRFLVPRKTTDNAPDRSRIEDLEVKVTLTSEAPLNLQDPQFGGADPNKGNDASVAVRAVLAKLAVTTPSNNTRGDFYCPPGDYRCDSPIIDAAHPLPNNVKMYGAGRNATRFVAGGEFDLVSIATSVSKSSIRDLWLGSDVKLNTNVCALKVIGGLSPTADGLTIENVRLQNMPQLLHAENLQQARFLHLDFVQSISGAVSQVAVYMKACVSLGWERWMAWSTAGLFGSHVVELDSDCDTIVGKGIELRNAGGSCLHLANSLGLGHTGPRIVRMNVLVTEGAAVAGTLVDDCRDAMLMAGEAANNGTDGVTVNGGTGVEIGAGFTALQNGNHGYNLAGGVGLGLLGAKASNNGTVSSGNYFGARVAAAAGARVQGCRLGDYVFTAGGSTRQKYGLQIEAATDRVIELGNDLSGNATGGINNLSTGTHNVIGAAMTPALSVVT